MNKNFLPLLLALSLAATATSCIKGSYSENYTTVDDFDYTNFALDNPDSTYHAGYFYGTSGTNVFNIKADEDKKYVAGFTISMLCDSVVKPGHVTRSEYCVANKAGAEHSPKGFAVYYQHPDPEQNVVNDINFVKLGLCTPKYVYVCNTNLVANLVKYGNDEIPPFVEGDYLDLTFKFYLDEQATTTQTVNLAKYDGSLSLLTDWTKVEFKDTGAYGYVDLVLTSNRSDLPLSCCIDEYAVGVIYER